MPLWVQVPIPAAWLFVIDIWTVSIVTTFPSCSPLKARYWYCLQWFSALTFFNSFSLCHSRGCCQISWIIVYFVRISSGRLAKKNDSRNTRIFSCISQQSFVATRLSSGTRGERRCMRNVDIARTARWVRIMKFFGIFDEFQLFF